MLCVVIFAGEKPTMSSTWTSGIDYTVIPEVDNEGNIKLAEENFGEG